MGLEEWRDRKVDALSKGMQQKIQFAATFISEPDLVILDEVFSGLDPLNIELLRDMILEEKDKGTTILFSTHMLAEAEKICDSICLIEGGEVILDGTTGPGARGLPPAVGAGGLGREPRTAGRSAGGSAPREIRRQLAPDPGRGGRSARAAAGSDGRRPLDPVLGQPAQPERDLPRSGGAAPAGGAVVNKILTVIRKEYLERVRSKSFLIGTLLGPALMSMFIVLPVLVADKGGDDIRTVGVIDPSGLYFDSLAEVMADWGRDNVQPGIDERAGPAAPRPPWTELKDAILDESIHSGILIAVDFLESRKATFYNKSVSSLVLRDEVLEPALNRVLREGRFAAAQVPDSLFTYLSAQHGVVQHRRHRRGRGRGAGRGRVASSWPLS